MRSDSDSTFWLIMVWMLIGAMVFGALLHQCSVTNECEQKRCASGSPMVVRDQSKVFGFSECVCVERAR